uniref:response regulator transcription factor n=1 Tax=Herbidospora sakaeratensis TaxID=564415 RepID=UPI000785F264|nr:response regulator transcription factor [Herbidospora sakaeratensis]
MIRVMIAEDMALLRKALVRLLEQEKDIEVVADIERGDEIVATALEVRPDVTILDVDLPGLDGLTAASQLHEAIPGVKTLILTSFGTPGYLKRALDAHVLGFIAKDTSPDQLSASIRKICNGEAVLDPAVVIGALQATASPLTAREIECLRLVAMGEQPRAIARVLALSLGTVRNYLAASITKLGARNRVDAVRIAREQGWL